MSRPNFEEVLDACVADIVAGRRTARECLEEWPQLRDRLEPLLEAAVAIRREPRYAERLPEPARRAQFMAALRQTPQQSSRRFSLRALTSRLAALTRGTGAPSTFRRAGLVAVPAVVAAIALIAVTLVLNRGATTAYASTLTVFAGGVEQQVGDAWQPLADGATLEEGARLRTDGEGSALLTFPDGSTVSIEPDTELRIDVARNGEARQIQLRQFTGRLWNDVVHFENPSATYAVHTPDAIVSAHGTLFEIIVVNGETEVNTSDGLVELQTDDQQAFVAPGETTTARASGEIDDVQLRDPGDEGAFALTVDAPFAASVVAPNGKATGVRPDGIAFRQIAGAATSQPADGPQRIELARPAPGTYMVLLRRLGAGSGEVVLTVGPNELSFPIDQVGEAVLVELRVSVEDGRLQVEPVNVRAVSAQALEKNEQVVVTEQAKRRAAAAAEQLARRQAQQAEHDQQTRPDDQRPTPQAGERPQPRANDEGERDETQEADRNDDAEGDEGDDERGPSPNLTDEARRRLLEQLADTSPDRLRQLLSDETRRKLLERLTDAEERRDEREEKARSARQCEDVAEFAPDSVAGCRRVIAEATSACAGLGAEARRDDCRAALEQASEDCSEVEPEARSACKRELKTLVDTIEERVERFERQVEGARTCDDVAGLSPGASAACERLIAGVAEACEGATEGQRREVCERALDRAEEACESLGEIAQRACKRELEEVIQAVEERRGGDGARGRDGKHEGDREVEQDERTDCDEWRDELSAEAFAREFPECLTDDEARLEDSEHDGDRDVEQDERTDCDEWRDELSAEAFAREFPECLSDDEARLEDSEHDGDRDVEQDQRTDCDEWRDELSAEAFAREFPECSADNDGQEVEDERDTEDDDEGGLTCNQWREQLTAEALEREFPECVLDGGGDAPNDGDESSNNDESSSADEVSAALERPTGPPSTITRAA